MKLRSTVVLALIATVVTALTIAAPASAQVNQQGLVNVAITDTTVQVPVGVGANICGVALNVLATAVNAADVDCTASGVAVADQSGGGGGGGTVVQNGLVNLAVTDTTIQVPISVAANVCGLAVNVLANALNTGTVDCTAEGVSTASRG